MGKHEISYFQKIDEIMRLCNILKNILSDLDSAPTQLYFILYFLHYKQQNRLSNIV